MLQISTGKFFTTDDLYVTRHNGVFYSNYKLNRDIETEAGALRCVAGGGDVVALLYEYNERLEAVRPDGQREFLASTGGNQMLQDFSAVVSFALNVTCTPDLDLARRLTKTERPPLGVPLRPKNYIPRVFDTVVSPENGDDERLTSFVHSLLGLERVAYEAAVRAIRRYVTGLHRVSDDLDLAYALLVAAVESVAQDFDDFQPAWSAYNQQRRERIDGALSRTQASTETVAAVREAILKSEHIALGNRYREFALRHVEPTFYREEAVGVSHPVRARDLPQLLDQAYKYRSAYVHQLRPLPRLLTHTPWQGDVVVAEGQPSLTLQGMARVAGHVIRTFIERGRKIAHENFDYRSALPNVVRVSLADRYWLNNAAGYDHRTASTYLAGFLRELASEISPGPSEGVAPMPEVIEKVERSVSGLAKPAQRLPMLTLYVLYNTLIKSETVRPKFERVLKRHQADLNAPSPESFLAHVLTGNAVPWSAEQLAQILEEYYERRGRRRAAEFPPLFEAALALVAAESFRVAGDDQHARTMIASAIECMPGHGALLELESRALGGELPPIDWRGILLARDDPSAMGGSAADGGADALAAPASDKEGANKTPNGVEEPANGGNGSVAEEGDGHPEQAGDA